MTNGGLMKKIKNYLPGTKHKKGQDDDVTTVEEVTYPPPKVIGTQAVVVDAHNNVLGQPGDGTTVVTGVLKDRTAVPYDIDAAGVARTPAAAEEKHHKNPLTKIFHPKHDKDDAAAASDAPVLHGGLGAPVGLKQEFATGMGQTTVVTSNGVPIAVNQMHDESELALKHAEGAAKAAQIKIDQAAAAAKHTTRASGGAPAVALAPATVAGTTSSLPTIVETITTTTTGTIGGSAGPASPSSSGTTLQVVKEAAVAGVEKTRTEAATGLQQASEALAAGRAMLINATSPVVARVKENVAWAAEKAKENVAWGAGKTQETAAASRDTVVDNSVPIIDKAKENAAWAAEQAKLSAIATKDAVVKNGAPVVERAKENAAWGIEKVQENAAWAANKAQEAYVAGKEMVQDALAPEAPHEGDITPADDLLEPPSQRNVSAAVPLHEAVVPQQQAVQLQAVPEVAVPVVFTAPVQQSPVHVAPVLARVQQQSQPQSAVGVVPSTYIEQPQSQKAVAVDNAVLPTLAEAQSQPRQGATDSHGGGGLYSQNAMEAVNQALAAGLHKVDAATSGQGGQAAHPPAQYGV